MRYAFIALAVLSFLSAASVFAVDSTDTTTLSGENEVPPVSTTATGTTTSSLDGITLTITGTFSGLTSDALEVAGSPAHVHMAAANATGPVVFPLTVTLEADNRSGNFSVIASLTEEQKNQFLDDLFYVNVHSVDNPTGEIRGQLTPEDVVINETGNNTNTTNNTNQTNTTGAVVIQAPYPSGMQYLFQCNPSDFTATSYTWTFGDGSASVTTTTNSVFHTFATNGAYTVTCVATDAAQATQSNELSVTVSTASTSSIDLFVKAWYPKDNDFVFVCSTPGATPSSYNWFYGDGEKLLEIANGDTYHRYKATGTYTVSCEANTAGGKLTDSLQVSVNTITYCDPGLICNGTPINNTGNNTNTTNQTGNSTQFVTVEVMKHLCRDDIQSQADFEAIQQGLDPVAALAATVLACPTTGLEGDVAADGSVAAERSSFDFHVMANGNTQMIDNAFYHQHKLCESDINLDADGNGNVSNSTCLDISHYRYDNVANGQVVVQEATPPAGYRFGSLKLTPTQIDGNNDADAVTSFGNGYIYLDTTQDNDGTIMLHVYNFDNTAAQNHTGNETNQTPSVNEDTTDEDWSVNIEADDLGSGEYEFTCVDEGTDFNSHYWTVTNVDSDEVIGESDELGDSISRTLAPGDYEVECRAQGAEEIEDQCTTGNDCGTASASTTITVLEEI